MGVSDAQASIQVVDEVISKAAAGLGLATNTAICNQVITIADFCIAHDKIPSSVNLAGQHQNGLYEVPAAARPAVATVAAVPSRDNTRAAREARLENQARAVLMGREVSKIFQANSGAVRGEVAAVNHAERTFLLAFENHATFEVAEAEVRAMLVDDAVGPLQSPPAQLPGTNLPRSGPVVPLPTKGLVSQPTDLAGALSGVALDAELQAEVDEILALFASPARKPATLVVPVRTRDVEGNCSTLKH